MSYRVVYHKRTQKFLKSNKKMAVRFFKAFDEIASMQKWQMKTYDIKVFNGFKYTDMYRLRIGKYRAIFRIIDDELMVFVFDVGSRGDIYK